MGFIVKLLEPNLIFSNCFSLPAISGKDGSKVTIVVATPGQGPDRPQEISYTDPKVIGNGSFGVVFEAKLCETGELVAIKKVLQDKRFKVSVYALLPYVCCTYSPVSLLSISEPGTADYEATRALQYC